MSGRPPSEVLASISAPNAELHPLSARRGAWRIEEAGISFVLRRCDPRAHATSEAVLLDDVGWVHRYLKRLGTTGFAASRPVDRLAGSSLGVFDGTVWETLTYLPGRVAGWSRRPSMGVLGAFLASYHDAASKLDDSDQRAPSYPVASLLTDVDATARRLSRRERAPFAKACEALRDGLVAVDHDQASRVVIHGDLTNHNVVVTGSPVRPVAAIDFANAYVEATLADVAFAMWRSGRPFQEANTFDVGRIAAFVAGYHRRRPLSERDVAAIVVYLRARGVQILVKQTRRLDGPIDTGPVAKLIELARIEQRLLDHITLAVT